jgi:hypothetical protein
MAAAILVASFCSGGQAFAADGSVRADADARRKGEIEVGKLAAPCKSGKKKACDTLAGLARTHSQWTVRQKALHALEAAGDVSLAAELARNDARAEVRASAIAMVQDQNALAGLARTASDPHVRREAIKKLSDERVLADIARGDTDAEIRRAAMGRIHDEKDLAGLARDAADLEVRREAIRNLQDDADLLAIAKSDASPSLRAMAVDRIRDRRALADLARNGGDRTVRRAAMEHLQDEAVLADIAHNDADSDMREAAMFNMHDPRELARLAPAFSSTCLDAGRLAETLARSCPAGGSWPHTLSGDFEIGMTVSFCNGGTMLDADDAKRLKREVENIGTPNGMPVLHIVLAGSPLAGTYTFGTRYKGAIVGGALVLETAGGQTAVECIRARLDPPASYIVAANSSGMWSKPEQAPFWDAIWPEASGALLAQAYRANGEAGLLRVAHKTSDRNLVRRALINVGDAALAAYVAANAAARDLPPEFVRPISDQGMLCKLALSNPDSNVRQAAIRKVDDQKTLAAVATSDPSWAVRIYAVPRVKDTSVLASIAKSGGKDEASRLASQYLDARRDLERAIAGQRSSQEKESAAAALALNSTSSAVRAVALELVEEPSVLMKIATTDLDVNIRWAAIRKIKDPAVLRLRLPLDITEAIGDPDLLEEYARQHPGSVSPAVVRRLRDTDTLKQIASTDGADGKLAAMARISDAAFLKDLEAKAKDPATRWEARLRLIAIGQ